MSAQQFADFLIRMAVRYQTDFVLGYHVERDMIGWVIYPETWS